MPDWSCQGAFNRPASVQAVIQRSFVNSSFLNPLRNRKSVPVKFDNLVREIMIVYRACQGAFNRPASVQAVMQHNRADITLPCPLEQSHSFSVKFDKPSIFSVVTLLYWSCPSTVFRGVIAVAINPINAGSDRAISHIRQKVFKQLPTLTKFDASPPISWVFFIVWIAASLAQRSPRCIQRMILSCFCMTMNNRAQCFCFLSVQAPTTLCFTVAQTASNGSGIIPAIAATQPEVIAASFGSSPLNNSQPSKSLAGQINYFFWKGHGYSVMAVDSLLSYICSLLAIGANSD